MSNANPTKIIIHNVTDTLPDETCIEMVLHIMRKGLVHGAYKNLTKFKGGYEVRARASCHRYITNTFFVTEKHDA